MIDHLGINTTAEVHEQTVAFYLAVLEPIGYKKIMEFHDGQVIGLGVSDAAPDFWIVAMGADGKPKKSVTNAHFAFSAADQSIVDQCYAKGLKAGGKDNGPPGLRTMYHPTYYGAFLFDPTGNSMEIVNHGMKRC